MASTSNCSSFKCGAITPGAVDACPACGARTMPSARVRRLGWLLLVLGAGLAVGIGYLLARMSPMLGAPGVRQPDGTTFTGTAEQAAFTTNLLLGVIAFGAVAVLNGLWQIATGRRNLMLFALTLLLAAALFLTARGASGTFGG